MNKVNINYTKRYSIGFFILFLLWILINATGCTRQQHAEDLIEMDKQAEAKRLASMPSYIMIDAVDNDGKITPSKVSKFK